MLWSTIGATGVKDIPIPAPSRKHTEFLQLSEHTEQPISFFHDTSKWNYLRNVYLIINATIYGLYHIK